MVGHHEIFQVGFLLDLCAKLLTGVLLHRPAKMHVRIHVAIGQCGSRIPRLQITAAFGAI